MNRTLLDFDPNDTGEVKRLSGETRTRIDTGEATQRIDPRLIKAPSFDAVPRKVIDLDDTVTFHSPMTIATGELSGPQSPPPPLPRPPRPSVPPRYDMAAAQPIAPWERVAETERISLLGLVAGLDGELRPSDYVGRHRHVDDLDGTDWEVRDPAHERRVSPWWALAGVVVIGATIWVGLLLAATVVTR